MAFFTNFRSKHIVAAITCALSFAYPLGCASDRCARPDIGQQRYYRQFNQTPVTREDYERAKHLPPEVIHAVHEYFRLVESGNTAPRDPSTYLIAAARPRDGYILLQVVLGIDSDRQLVYSPRYQCIVGTVYWFQFSG